MICENCKNYIEIVFKNDVTGFLKEEAKNGNWFQCNRCEESGFIDNQCSRAEICDFIYEMLQPERSKREDVLETTDKVVAMASIHRAMPAFNFVVNKRCGTLDTVET
jgi:hypothetical protein